MVNGVPGPDEVATPVEFAYPPATFIRWGRPGISLAWKQPHKLEASANAKQGTSCGH